MARPKKEFSVPMNEELRVTCQSLIDTGNTWKEVSPDLPFWKKRLNKELIRLRKHMKVLLVRAYRESPANFEHFRNRLLNTGVASSVDYKSADNFTIKWNRPPYIRGKRARPEVLPSNQESSALV